MGTLGAVLVSILLPWKVKADPLQSLHPKRARYIPHTIMPMGVHQWMRTETRVMDGETYEVSFVQGGSVERIGPTTFEAELNDSHLVPVDGVIQFYCSFDPTNYVENRTDPTVISMRSTKTLVGSLTVRIEVHDGVPHVQALGASENFWLVERYLHAVSGRVRGFPPARVTTHVENGQVVLRVEQPEPESPTSVRKTRIIRFFNAKGEPIGRVCNYFKDGFRAGAHEIRI